MKKFVIRVFLYFALVVGVIGGVCALEISAEIRAYREELVAPPEATVLVIGDSQAGDAVDPSVCREFFNFCAHGRALDQSYLTAIDLFDRNAGGGLKTVVLDVSPASAVVSFASGIGEIGYAGKYWLLHYLHPAENTRSLYSGIVVARDNLVGRRLRHFWRAIRGKLKFESSLKGEFIEMESIDKALSPDRYWGLLKSKVASTQGLSELSPESPFAVDVLDRFIKLARDRGVEPVFITTPWNEDLREACGKENLDAFTRVMETFANQRGCVYIDFLRTKFAEELWQDANHLNKAGAVVFTKMLESELRKRAVPR